MNQRETALTLARITPGPWRVIPGTGKLQSIRQDIVTDALEYKPSFVVGDALPEDAAFIVKACNTHDALVEALQECITQDGALAWRSAEFAGQRLEAISNIARAALALEKGGCVKTYRTFKRTCHDWRSFARARKIEDMRNLSHEEAYNRCQRLNAELTPAQKRRGTKFEFESQ